MTCADPITRSYAKQADSSDRATGPVNLVAAPLSHGSNPNSNAAGRRREDDVNLVPDIARSLNSQRDGYNDGSDQTYIPALTRKMAKGTGGPSGDECQNLIAAPSLTAANDPSRSPQSSEITQQVETLTRAGAGVRRLTPTECERLQGLPDGWTLPGSDSKRYAALGDAVTASVAFWIGQRIIASVAPLLAEEGR